MLRSAGFVGLAAAGGLGGFSGTAAGGTPDVGVDGAALSGAAGTGRAGALGA